MRRDELLRYGALRLKFTVPQLMELSRTWPWPFFNEANLWRRLVALGIGNKVKRVAEQSLHDMWTAKVCLKVWRDAARNGIEVRGAEKEYKLGEGSAIRADMKFYLGSRLYFLETQQSALTFRGWKAKLGKYVRYRRKSGPFRVLLILENERNLNTVYRYCKEVTAHKPNLALFLLAWQPDLLGQFDTVAEAVWVTNRVKDRRPETVSLVA
jgi:hypothetical protein